MHHRINIWASPLKISKLSQGVIIYDSSFLYFKKSAKLLFPLQQRLVHG
jgi:hypothetical protein